MKTFKQMLNLGVKYRLEEAKSFKLFQRRPENSMHSWTKNSTPSTQTNIVDTVDIKRWDTLVQAVQSILIWKVC